MISLIVPFAAFIIICDKLERIGQDSFQFNFEFLSWDVKLSLYDAAKRLGLCYES